MQLSYDPKVNVAYIRLRERQGDGETIAVTSDFLVDIDETGAVCGIELLNANEQLTGGMTESWLSSTTVTVSTAR